MHGRGLLAAKLLLFTPWAFLKSWQLSNTVCLLCDGCREGEDLLQQVGDEAGHLLASLIGALGLAAKGHLPVNAGHEAVEGQVTFLSLQDFEQGLEEHGSKDIEEGHVACRV